jgi:hypothetical protein
MDAADDRIFNAELAKVGLVQHPDKAIRQIFLHSAGSLGILRALNRNHGVVGNFKFDPEARYLGPWLHPTGGFQFEMKRRIKAMNKIWGMWCKFWFSRAPFKMKLIFRCVIVSTVLSAIVSFAISEKQYRTVSTETIDKARKILAHRAFKKSCYEKLDFSTGDVDTVVVPLNFANDVNCIGASDMTSDVNIESSIPNVSGDVYVPMNPGTDAGNNPDKHPEKISNNSVLAIFWACTYTHRDRHHEIKLLQENRRQP